MSHRSSCSSRRRRAFTLVELLVVIGVIAILMSLLLPALNNAREASRKTKCAAGLHNIGIAMNVYANENKRKLPVQAGPGNNWLWDIPIATRDAIVKAGAVRDSFYCPSGDLQNDDVLWSYNGWTVSGYWWLMQRLNGPLSGVGLQLQNYPIDAPNYMKELRKRIDLPRSSEIELVADANISVGNPPRFAGVDGGWPSHRSNHLKRGNQGVGGNILFLDGHVEWRDIKAMKIRFTPGHDEWF